MKIHFVCVGELRRDFTRDGVDEYLRRIRRHLPVDMIELRAAAGDMAAESAALESRLARLAARNRLRTLLLDERGRQADTLSLAGLIESSMGEGVDLAFAIGGAYGVEPGMRDRHELLALSKLTLPHRIARLVLVEQIYRALSIIRREPYHNP